MDSYRQLHRRLADITNLDIEHSCKQSGVDRSKARPGPRSVVITASGFYGPAKQQLQQLAASIGATYSGDLVLGTTTHLICKRLIDCFGTAKYQRALQWGIHIVTYEWLEASSVAGKPVPEQDYKDDQPQALKLSPRPVRKQQIQHNDQQPRANRRQSNEQESAGVPYDAAAATSRDALPAQTSSQHNCDAAELAVQQQAQLPGDEQQQQQQQQGVQQTPPAAGTQQTLSLADLPKDFLLQGSEPEDEDPTAAAEDDVTLPSRGAFSFSLSQHSLQQQREQERRHQELASAPAVAAAGEAGFDFAQPTAVTDAAEQTSPCMQHFLPMQQQQQGLTDPSSDSSNNSEIQAEGIPQSTPIQSRAASARVDAGHVEGQQQRLQGQPGSPMVSLQHLEQVLHSADVGAAADPSDLALPAYDAEQPPPASPVSPASSIISADGPDHMTAAAPTAAAAASAHDNSADTSDVGSPIGLTIPETQAELADPWGAAAADGGTPVSLKYYASQQRSRTRTAAAKYSAARVGSDFMGFSPAAALQAEQQGLNQQQQERTQDDETSDETEEPSEDLSDVAAGAAAEDLTEDVVQQELEHPARPWSGSSSTAPQQQHPDFRLTKPSNTGGSSRRSSGLTRLQRRDGYRPLGRVIVSQLPEPSELELQDSDCELQDSDSDQHDPECELQDSDCEVDCKDSSGDREVLSADLGNEMILEDSDCEDQHEHQFLLQQRQELAAVNKPISRGHAVQHSPVHSCSASSQPALSDGAAAVRAAPRPLATSTRGAASPGVSSAETPAASAVSDSSNGEMPVMQLSFSLAGATASTPGCEQQGGSIYSPSSSCMSSEYSPAVSMVCRMGTVGASRMVRVDQHTPAAAAAAAEEEDEQHMQQKNAMTAGKGLSHLSDHSQFITKRRGRGGASMPQQQQRSPSAAAAAAAIMGQVFVKLEPVEASNEQQKQQQLEGQQTRPAQTSANPSDAMLRAFKQQRQQQTALKPAPVKIERPSPAEQLLQDLRQRQGQQQQCGPATVAAAEGTEPIDDEADSQGLRLGLNTKHQRGVPSAHLKVPRNSVASYASYATDISTASRKVPLMVLGGADKVIDGGASAAEAQAGSTTPLERLLQATLVATRRDSGGAAVETSAAGDSASAPGGIAVKQEAVKADWVHTPEGDGSKTAAAMAAAAADSEDDAFEITELPTKVVTARNKAMTKQLDAHLAHLSQAGGDQVIPLKLLSKAPRGSTAKAFHGIRASNKLVYADQVQVPWAHAILSTKEKSRCVIVADTAAGKAASAADAAAASFGSGSNQEDKVFLAEPIAFYKLESGEWWLELLRFYSTKELRLLAKAADCKLHLPADFHLSYELLRDMTHEHVPMKGVQGEFKLGKVKKVPSGSRSRANPFFWRYSIDTATCQVLTDRPVADYVVQ